METSTEHESTDKQEGMSPNDLLASLDDKQKKALESLRKNLDASFSDNDEEELKMTENQQPIFPKYLKKWAGNF